MHDSLYEYLMSMCSCQGVPVCVCAYVCLLYVCTVCVHVCMYGGFPSEGKHLPLLGSGLCPLENFVKYLASD